MCDKKTNSILENNHISLTDDEIKKLKESKDMLGENLIINVKKGNLNDLK